MSKTAKNGVGIPDGRVEQIRKISICDELKLDTSEGEFVAVVDGVEHYPSSKLGNEKWVRKAYPKYGVFVDHIDGIDLELERIGEEFELWSKAMTFVRETGQYRYWDLEIAHIERM